MAYPFGGRTDITPEGILAAKSAGYSALASNFGGENFPGDDPFAIRRIDLGGDRDALMWKAAMHGLDLGPWRVRLGLERRRTPRNVPMPARPVARSPEDRHLRVTQIVFDLDGGGMETLVAAMAERSWNTDVRMSVITLSGRVGRVGERVRSLVEQFHVPRLAPGVSMIAPGALTRAIVSTRPDVVHVHSGAWLKGAYAATLAGVGRIVYTEHGREHHDPAIARAQDYLASLCTHCVVAVSERLRQYMIRAIHVNAGKVSTISNGVDTTLFAPGPADPSLRRSLGIPENALVIGSIGRLEPVKAYRRLVEAYAELRRTNFGRPLVLVIFGEGSDRPAIESTIDRLGVRDGVRLPGWTGRPVDGYRLFDVFAMTSTSEGMSVSLMEAMACGVSPVVTDVGANAEVMGPELGDLVVAPGDHGQLVGAMRHLLDSDSDRGAAGARARQRVAERYSVAVMMERYERIYRGVV
jgi:glycosyltransferase involved in cell wall biosynthesis